ncbi:MAG: TIGR03790 family protein [Pseudomonadota bacterium]
MNGHHRLPLRIRCALQCLLMVVFISGCNAGTETEADNPPVATSLGPEQLGVIVNDNDPDSQAVAAYYMEKRGIPAGNLIHAQLTPGRKVMNPDRFRLLLEDVRANTPASVQAYVLTWTLPYRVGCMSITTAFAAGFDEAWCAKGCKATQKSPYYNAGTTRPFTDLGVRPTMMLAGESFEDVRALIDRGIAADGSRPNGTGYLLSTTDRARNVRARFYHGIILMQSDRFGLKVIQGNTLQHRPGVMFYFTGLPHVKGIETNRYRPGAIADHLTSAGGKLSGSGQMSSLEWLKAGATGSYGTVVEPCAFVQKFPRPDIVINRYLNGETLIESYWKSVAWPGQGIFIGEPLAAPFRDPRE